MYPHRKNIKINQKKFNGDIAMHMTRSGQTLIGYGRNVKCENCNNLITERIVYDLTESSVFLLRYMSDTGFITVCCPVCHHYPTPSERVPFSQTLKTGLKHTLDYFNGLVWLQKRKYLKDLKKLFTNEDSKKSTEFFSKEEHELNPFTLEELYNYLKDQK